MPNGCPGRQHPAVLKGGLARTGCTGPSAGEHVGTKAEMTDGPCDLVLLVTDRGGCRWSVPALWLGATSFGNVVASLGGKASDPVAWSCRVTPHHKNSGCDDADTTRHGA